MSDLSNLGLSDLKQQREVIEKEIQKRLNEERAQKIAEVRQIIAEYGLTPDDVFKKGRAHKEGGAKVAPKYRNPETGETWTGRGKPPSWIKDVADRSVFEIKEAAAS